MPTKRQHQRRHKYNAKGRWIDDKWFASQAEASRYEQLKELLKAGDIERLECQPKFPLTVNNTKITTYIADFQYVAWDEQAQRMEKLIVEDVKGMITAEYNIKRKLLHALYPDINFCEIKSTSISKWEGRIPDPETDAMKEKLPWTRGRKK